MTQTVSCKYTFSLATGIVKCATKVHGPNAVYAANLKVALGACKIVQVLYLLRMQGRHDHTSDWAQCLGVPIKCGMLALCQMIQEIIICYKG